jgi:hypothetical protein
VSGGWQRSNPFELVAANNLVPALRKVAVSLCSCSPHWHVSAVSFRVITEAVTPPRRRRGNQIYGLTLPEIRKLVDTFNSYGRPARRSTYSKLAHWSGITPISDGTARRLVHHAGYHRCVVSSKPRLSASQKAQRLEFALSVAR